MIKIMIYVLGIAPIFEMFNHSSENNAFFDFDMINKNLYVATREDISEGINSFTLTPTLSEETRYFYF